MFKKKVILPAFLVMVLIQLFVPAKMIFDQERILRTGKEYKFKTAPIDPNDPFRGKYISLRYDMETLDLGNKPDWQRGETIYILLGKDSLGFAKALDGLKEKPQDTPDFVEARVSYATAKSREVQQLMLEFPFDRFYMEESKAVEAEDIYRESQIDSSQVAYALVSIRDGKGVLKDVIINETPIREFILQEREQQ